MKDAVWRRDGEDIRVIYDRREQFVLADPGGGVERLLRLLRDGDRGIDELAAALSGPDGPASATDVRAALDALDDCRLVEDADRRGQLDGDATERYFANLAFFESFATLGRGREDLQVSLRDAHVLVLGTGGLNSNTIPHLCGLGIGRLTLVDRDVVEPRNFVRQYLYRWSDIGGSKVARAAAWVRDFDPAIVTEAIDLSIDGPDAIGGLIERVRPTVVMSGVDSPVEVDDWVNAMCVAHGVPYVRAGMFVTQGVVWSVDPGRSACRACARHELLADPDNLAADDVAAVELFRAKTRVNRGIGPVAGLLGSLAAFEVLRYVTGFEPPAYAGAPLLIDFAAGCATDRYVWPRRPDCPVCGSGRGTAHEKNERRWP